MTKSVRMSYFRLKIAYSLWILFYSTQLLFIHIMECNNKMGATRFDCKTICNCVQTSFFLMIWNISARARVASFSLIFLIEHAERVLILCVCVCFSLRGGFGLRSFIGTAMNVCLSVVHMSFRWFDRHSCASSSCLFLWFIGYTFAFSAGLNPFYLLIFHYLTANMPSLTRPPSYEPVFFFSRRARCKQEILCHSFATYFEFVLLFSSPFCRFYATLKIKHYLCVANISHYNPCRWWLPHRRSATFSVFKSVWIIGILSIICLLLCLLNANWLFMCGFFKAGCFKHFLFLFWKNIHFFHDKNKSLFLRILVLLINF